jgi:hypothetical protein
MPETPVHFQLIIYQTLFWFLSTAASMPMWKGHPKLKTMKSIFASHGRGGSNLYSLLTQHRRPSLCYTPTTPETFFNYFIEQIYAF